MENAKRRTIKIFLSIVFIIFITDTVLFATNAQYSFIAIKRFSVVVVAITMVFSKFFIRKTPTYDLDIALITCSLLTSMFLAGSFVGYMYFTQIACLVFGMCYSLLVSQEEFAEMFIKIMRIIAIVSLIGFALPSVVTALPLPVIVNKVGLSFKSLLLTNVPTSQALQGRNYGPFWEPGAYQFYINIAFYFSLFVAKKRNMYDVLLFSVTCITTKSGASFVGLGLILLAYIVANRDKKDKIKWLIIPVVLIIVVNMLSNTEFYRAFEKVFGGLESEDNISFGYRFAAVKTYLKATFRSPIFGNSDAVLEEMMSEEMYKLIGVSDGGNTNTVLSFFAYFGVFVGGYIVKRIYIVVRQNSSSVLVAMLLFAAIIATTSNENFTCSLLFSVLLFLKKEDVSSVKNKEEEVVEGNCFERCYRWQYR